MIQHPRVERTTVHAAGPARRYGHTLYVSVRRRLSTLIAVEGKCTDSSCREIGAVPGRAPRGGYHSITVRTVTVHGPTDDPTAGHTTCRVSRPRADAEHPEVRRGVLHSTVYGTPRVTARPASLTPVLGDRPAGTLRRPPTQDKTLTNHSNHQARSPRHKQASPRGTNHRHKASSHPHVAISSSNRRARPRAESPTPHLNLAMLLHGGITASRSS